MALDRLLQDKKTEEIQDIIERMPINFGRIVSTIVLGVFCLISIFSWIIRYPDIVTGELTLSASQVPVKLVAVQSGKLKLANISSQDEIEENQVIAYIESATDFGIARQIQLAIDSLTLPLDKASSLFITLPKEAALGELSTNYFQFLNALKQLADYQTNQIYAKQQQALEELLGEQRAVLDASLEKAKISLQNHQIYKRFFRRDSTLFRRNVLSEADLDRSRINLIAAEDILLTTRKEIAVSREQIARTNSQINDVLIQRVEREQQLDLELSTSYNSLLDVFRMWEQQYLFLAPIKGRLQFLRFWENYHFVRSGDEVFTVLPAQESVKGQINLPAQGAGKVKVGQEVIVKLDDYPYMEYGSVSAKVDNISLTTKSVNSEVGNFKEYLVSVEFPDLLQTNYGSKLDFKYELKGTAEIVTSDRRLFDRFFDNLKYVMER